MLHRFKIEFFALFAVLVISFGNFVHSLFRLPIIDGSTQTINVSIQHQAIEAFEMSMHLSKAQLEWLSVGALKDGELVAVATHVAECETCHTAFV